MAATLIDALALGATVAQAADALPSWNDGKTKQAILAFGKKVTKKGGPDFVPPAERIATFDNDGTLWAEQVIGSSTKVKYELRDGKPVRIRLSEIDFIDDTEFSPPRMRWVAESRGGEELAESDWGMAC